MNLHRNDKFMYEWCNCLNYVILPRPGYCMNGTKCLFCYYNSTVFVLHHDVCLCNTLVSNIEVKKIASTIFVRNLQKYQGICFILMNFSSAYRDSNFKSWSLWTISSLGGFEYLRGKTGSSRKERPQSDTIPRQRRLSAAFVHTPHGSRTASKSADLSSLSPF
jgi:hypothetical protein